MVPLRIDSGEGKTSSWAGVQPHPRLVLCDTTVEATPVRRQSVLRPHAAFRQWESRIFGFALLSVLLFFLSSFLSFLWHTAAASYQTSFGTPVTVITRRVASGDTLWRYAAAYGDPNTYILDRVETIARDNRLSSDTPLVPGQVVRIAVHNPVILAQMQHQHQSRLASLPRF